MTDTEITVDLGRILEDIAKAIVDNPDSVNVKTESQDDGTINLTLSVAESDMGMIIGKHGKIARAIRTVMKSAAKFADKKVVIEIK